MAKDSINYFHRDLSWLLFNRRVIEKSYDEDYPILEQFRFLAIAASNLDEFYSVRVPAIQSLARLKPHQELKGTGRTHVEVLKKLSRRNKKNIELQYRRYHELVQRLQGTSVNLKRFNELDTHERYLAQEYFNNVIFPTLLPIGLDSYMATPKITGKLVHFFIHLEKKDEEDQRVILPLPAVLKRLVQLEDTGTYISLEEIIHAHFDQLFSGYTVKRYFAFRITYDQDPEFEEDPDDDMVGQIEEYLHERRRGLPTRVEISLREEQRADFEHDIDQLKDEFKLKNRDFYYINGPLDLTYLFSFIKEIEQTEPGWVFPNWQANKPAGLAEGEIFETIAQGDVLIQHPYDSYEAVIHFLTAAAKDPDTVVIKMTLYRLAEDSQVIEALELAAAAGKQVIAVVELRARFDEENNINWVKELEEAGVFVSYGVAELKTHSKIAMVVKRHGTETKTYVHLATGNYNEKTARIYTDLSLFSCRGEYVHDATAFFNHLTGYSETPNYVALAVSPDGIEQMLLSEIDKQIALGAEGAIFIKVNALTSYSIIDRLYAASAAGVKVRLLIRGACVLRPGFPGLSETIEVRSIIGRFLEHSRIYAFGKDEAQEIWISSADAMTRNLKNRVEIAARLLSENTIARAKTIIDMFVSLDRKAFFLDRDEHYTQRKEVSAVSPQTHFVQEAEAKGKMEVRVQPSVAVAVVPAPAEQEAEKSGWTLLKRLFKR